MRNKRKEKEMANSRPWPESNKMTRCNQFNQTFDSQVATFSYPKFFRSAVEAC